VQGVNSQGAIVIGALHERPAQAEHLQPRLRRRHIVAALVAVALVGGGLATFLELRHLDHRYGPVQQGFFGGLYSDTNFVFSKDGFSYSLSDTPGAAAQLISTLSNLGDHSVKVTSIDTDRVVSSIRWSSYRFGTDQNVEGVDTPWRPFPAIVPAHGTIRLLITIQHPGNCGSYPPGEPSQSSNIGQYYSGLHTVHWDSLLHSHSTVIDDGIEERNIRVC
jgi:hypothetical protein